MAKKKDPVKGNGGIDNLVKKMLVSMDPDQITEYNMSKRGAELKNIIRDELNLSKGISNGSIIDFSRSLANHSKNLNSETTLSDTTDDILKYINQNSSTVYQFFNERERNKYIEARDLKFISKFNPSLGQAVRLALTHIVSSDDLSGQVTRNLHFGDALTENDINIVRTAIEKFENENKLLMRLKNTVYNNTLISGTYYVYAISYKKLFTNYAKTLAQKKAMMEGKVNTDKKHSNNNKKVGYAQESVTISLTPEESTIINSILKDDIPRGNESTILNSNNVDGILESAATVECIKSEVPEFIFEELGTDLNKLKGSKIYSAMEASLGDSTSLSSLPDATVDIKDVKIDGKYEVSGTYIKYIPATSITPIKVMGECLGYFYVMAERVDRNKPSLSIVNGNVTNIKKQSALDKIVSTLAKRTAQVFSDKFVAENVAFKKMIADCIMANGVTNTEYKIQFIPAEDIIPFTINEDENGNGTSILLDSMFPAKLEAAISMRKSLNYINKSGDKTILHIRGGNADISRKNQAMRIARNMQEQNIVAADIFGDSNIMFQKYSADGVILMPSSRSGNRLVEFEKMDGQQIDTGVEWEKNLQNQSILATGVPPLLIEQYNQADFAKAFTTAHVGLAGIVANWQADLEEPTTVLYKRIIENLDIDENLKNRVLPVFRFTLPRPKALATNNTNEAIGSAQALADAYINIKYGEQSDDSNKEPIRAVKEAIIKELTPFIPWNKLDAIAEEAFLKAKEVKDETPNDVGADDGSDMFS